MTSCHACGGRMTVAPSAFPGFDLLACEQCHRPIKLIIRNSPRPAGGKPPRKGDLNRAIRAARRLQARKAAQ